MFLNIDDDQSKFGALISVELFTQLAENINYLIDGLPIGSVIPVLVGLTGVPTPDPILWQECDGSSIMDANPNSPLRNGNTPDYVTEGLYVRNYTTIGEVGNTGGSNTKDLSHDHGGITEDNPPMDNNADTDNDFWTGKNHHHSIASALGVENWEPSHCRVKHYIKIADSNDINAVKFLDMQTDFGTTVAQALWTNASKNINSLNKAYPIGMLNYFYATQPNMPALPDSRFWHLADGSTVSDTASPLFGQALPDLRQKFVRHPLSGDTPLSTGGGDFVGGLFHDHGGLTGVTNDRNDFQMDGGDELFEADAHQHTISADLHDSYATTPPYVELQIYVRIA